jgi:hypothetical protein
MCADRVQIPGADACRASKISSPNIRHYACVYLGRHNMHSGLARSIFVKEMISEVMTSFADSVADCITVMSQSEISREMHVNR